MKKLFISLLLLCGLSLSAIAQDNIDAQSAAAQAAAALIDTQQEQAPEPKKPNYWTNSIQFDLGFSYTGLTNWAAGGYNTLVLNTGIDAKAKYAKDLMKWDNRLQLQYGFLWAADKKNLLQKSNDLMKLESSFSYKTSKTSKWDYSISFDYRSQFSNSYDSYKLNEVTNKWEGTLKSGFASPAYANIALGMVWNPASWFDASISPLTGGFTICSIEDLRKKYGMKLLQDDLDPDVMSNYRSALFQFGAQVKMNFRASINDKFNYETQLVLFTDYLNKPFQQVRVNWDNKFSLDIAKYFKIAFNTWLIYDPIVVIDGGSKIQFKRYFSINFTYLIKNK